MCVFICVCVCCVCVCVCVCVSIPIPKASSMMWCDEWTLYDWLNKFYNFYIAAVVGIGSRYGLCIDLHHRNQPNKNKLALYIRLIHLNSHLKQLYICNKM